MWNETITESNPFKTLESFLINFNFWFVSNEEGDGGGGGGKLHSYISTLAEMRREVKWEIKHLIYERYYYTSQNISFKIKCTRNKSTSLPPPTANPKNIQRLFTHFQGANNKILLRFQFSDNVLIFLINVYHFFNANEFFQKFNFFNKKFHSSNQKNWNFYEM